MKANGHLRHVDIRCDRSESRSSSGPPAAHGPLAGPAAGGAKVGMRRRVGPLRVAQLLRPAYGPRSQEWSRGRRCRGMHTTTRSFPLRVEQLLRPAYGPRSQEWSRGRRCRDAHASTRSLRGPSTAGGPGWAHGRRCRFVQRRAAPAWPAHGPRSQLVPRPAVPRGACGSVPVMRSRRWRSESGWAVRYGPW
jgi:hypothetical protein